MYVIFLEQILNFLVWFYGISTNVGHLMPNPLYIKYTIPKHILKITSLNEPEPASFTRFQMVSLNFKQFSSASVQFFVHTQVHVKTVHFKLFSLA